MIKINFIKRYKFNINYWFLASVVFYISYALITQYDWLVNGGMWSEMATDYFLTAQNNNWVTKFFATDAGYIPFPQRIIAYLVYLLTQSTQSVKYVPYLYATIAISLTAFMVGVFCLRIFRSVVESDLLRFLTCITIFVVIDFETRTFLSFTYFVTFFLLIVTMLAVSDTKQDVPKWAWCVPILMLSKIYVLSVLPAMMVAFFVAKNRFRKIVIVTSIVGIIQVLQLFIWHMAYVRLHNPSSISLLAKVFNGFEYFLSYISAYLLGPKYYNMLYQCGYLITILLGVVIIISTYVLIKKHNLKVRLLIILPLLVMCFNMIMSSIALSEYYSADNLTVNHVIEIGKYNFGSFIGFTVFFAVLISFVGFQLFKNIKYRRLCNVILFLTWLSFTGWLSAGWRVSKLSTPMIGNSYWLEMASSINKEEHVCIPIDPFGWVFGTNCSNLDLRYDFRLFNYQLLKVVNYQYVIDLDVPQNVTRNTLHSFAIFLRNSSGVSNRKTPVMVIANAVALNTNDEQFQFTGKHVISSSGYLLLLNSISNAKARNIKNIRVVLSVDSENSLLELAYRERGDITSPEVLWMGY